MKKLTLTISILLSVGIEIIAQPVSYLPNQNTFQPVINPQKMRNWDDEIRTIDLYNSNAGKVIYYGESLAIKLYGARQIQALLNRFTSKNKQK